MKLIMTLVVALAVALTAMHFTTSVAEEPEISGVILIQRVGHKPEMVIVIDESGRHVALQSHTMTEADIARLIELIPDTAQAGKVTVNCGTGT